VKREWSTEVGPVDLMCRDEDGDWVAVNTVIEEHTAWSLIPKLKQANAQGIVEYPLNKVVI